MGRSAVIAFRDRSMTAYKMIRDDWGRVRPSLINAPYENDSKILGIGKKVQNHLNYSVSCLINEALRISSCSMSSLK